MEKNETPWKFQTRVIHTAQSPVNWHGSTLPPIHQTASHAFETAQSLSDSFAGRTSEPIYMRLSNPTNTILEEKIAALEGGQGAVAMSSGMAAVANTCMAMLRAGDELVSGNSLFMSTYMLFTKVFQKYGIQTRFAESTETEAIREAINDRTRFIYLETIGNPKIDVPDLARVATVAHEFGLPLVVDNTLATPYLCRPLDLGADVVIHSTTKYLSGHGAALGGVVVDGGRFFWNQKRFSDFKPFVDRKGPLALLDRVWREHHINFGTTQAPFHAYLTMIGLDTLAVRMERHMSNTLDVARYLSKHKDVQWVNYPGLQGHPSKRTAEIQFGGKGYGGMLTFGLGTQVNCFRFIQSLRLIYHLANLGDCKTLVIHPYSSQYVSFDEPTREALSVPADMIRLSVGIEAVEDICDDLGQALDQMVAA